MGFEINEKQLRIRYIRVVEKFLTRTISLLKLENLDRELKTGTMPPHVVLDLIIADM